MSNKKLHKTGVWLSLLCTIHCLAMPFALTAMPFLGETVVDETAEHYLILGSIVLAVALLYKDYRHHRNVLPLAFVGISAIFSFVGIFIASPLLEPPFVVTGAIMMSVAYYINWKKHQVVCSH